MKKFLVAILMMAPLALNAQKFAHFNSADIIPNMKEYTTAQTEIQNMAKQFDDDLKLMQDELQKKTEEYQKEQANLLENVRTRREQELNDLYQRMQQVLDAVKKIGEAGGYVYVIDTNAGAIPFVNTTLSTDITAEIKKSLGVQ